MSSLVFMWLQSEEDKRERQVMCSTFHRCLSSLGICRHLGSQFSAFNAEERMQDTLRISYTLRDIACGSRIIQLCNCRRGQSV